MSSSASNRQNGVLFDTNVLSHFAKIQRLPLLLQAFVDTHRAKQLHISPVIRRELEIGVQHGAVYLQEALQLIEDGVGYLWYISSIWSFMRNLLRLPSC